MKTIRRLVFGAAVAASLGFGGAQALAAPAGRPDAAARGCTPESCEKRCQTQYGVSGFCTGRGCWCLT